MWPRPALIAVAPMTSGTSIGTDDCVIPATPSWPVSLCPQHETLPSESNAHTCAAPTAIAVVPSIVTPPLG